MRKQIKPCSVEEQVVIETFFMEENNDLFLFAKNMIRNEALAEEAVQETFVCALQNYDKFCNSEDRKKWLFATEKNILRHMYRDKQRTLKLFVSTEEEYLEPAQEEKGYDAIDMPTEDPDYRLLVRFYMEGMSIRELAHASGITVSACKMRLKRARERLAKRWNE